jgi:hypothetical protein
MPKCSRMRLKLHTHKALSVQKRSLHDLLWPTLPSRYRNVLRKPKSRAKIVENPKTSNLFQSPVVCIQIWGKDPRKHEDITFVLITCGSQCRRPPTFRKNTLSPSSGSSKQRTVRLWYSPVSPFLPLILANMVSAGYGFADCDAVWVLRQLPNFRRNIQSYNEEMAK